MKDTKTAKASPECPTLLHYVARVLLRSDPSVVTFIEDMPHIEAAARGWFFHPKTLRTMLISFTVSVQTITTSVQALSTGLTQLQEEIKQLQRMRLPPEDRFISVMQVRIIDLAQSSC